MDPKKKTHAICVIIWSFVSVSIAGPAAESCAVALSPFLHLVELIRDKEFCVPGTIKRPVLSPSVQTLTVRNASNSFGWLWLGGLAVLSF